MLQKGGRENAREEYEYEYEYKSVCKCKRTCDSAGDKAMTVTKYLITRSHPAMKLE